MPLWQPINADPTTQYAGMVVRAGAVPGEVLLAQADSEANAARVVGARVADVLAAAAGLVRPLEPGALVRMAAEPAVNDVVYLSAAAAGIGVTAAPAVEIVLGICYEKIQVGGVWFAHVSNVVSPRSSSDSLVTRTVYSTAGAYNHTLNASTKKFLIDVYGGGGAGGGAVAAAGGAAVGGGGGSGGYCSKLIVVASGIVAVTVGAGGTGVAAAQGNAGSNSTVVYNGITYTGGGGGGGYGMNGGLALAATSGAGGGGATANGDINKGSQPGGFGVVLSGTVYYSGNGGLGPLGNNCNGRASEGLGYGFNGPGYSGGGAGSASVSANSYPGGDGAPGLVIITEYN